MDAGVVTEDIADDKSKAAKTSEVGDWLEAWIKKQ